MNMTPRDFFQKHHEEDYQKLTDLLVQPWFGRVVNLTLAQMASNEPLELRQNSFPPLPGANEFVRTLHGMAAMEVPVKRESVGLPTYELTSAQILEQIRKDRGPE